MLLILRCFVKNSPNSRAVLLLDCLLCEILIAWFQIISVYVKLYNIHHPDTQTRLVQRNSYTSFEALQDAPFHNSLENTQMVDELLYPSFALDLKIF